MTNRLGRGFTLIEVMVAGTIGMIIIGLSASAYMQCQKLIKRTEASVRLHRIAGDIAEKWEKDIVALMHQSACNVTTTIASGVKSDVQFTFMRTVEGPWQNGLHDFPNDTDMTWVRWEWKRSDSRLSRAESPPPHWQPWYPYGELASLEWSRTRMCPILAMRPTPVRTYAEFTSGHKTWIHPLKTTAGAPTPGVPLDPVSGLPGARTYDMLFLTGVDADGSTTYRGISEEFNGFAPRFNTPNLFLSANTTMGAPLWESIPVPDMRRPISSDITDLSITIVDKSSIEYVNATRSFVGVDRDGYAAADMANRPDVAKLTFTIIDRSTGISQLFTFCSRAP